MASSFFSTCCTEETGKGGLEPAAARWRHLWAVPDLLRSPPVAQRPQLVRMGDAHLVQGGQVPGQVRSKVLGDFRQVGDVLRAQKSVLA